MFDRKEYLKVWRSVNAEKLNERNREFYHGHKELWSKYRKTDKYKEKTKERRDKNPDYSKSYYQKNANRLKKLARDKYKNKKLLPPTTPPVWV